MYMHFMTIFLTTCTYIPLRITHSQEIPEGKSTYIIKNGTSIVDEPSSSLMMEMLLQCYGQMITNLSKAGE
jgi:hypothetical protein